MSARQQTILVVDDDPKVRKVLARALQADGHRVLQAATADEVHRTLASDNIDLVTLDLQLGADNGLAIAAKLKATSSVPIIMVTGKGDVIDTVVGLEMGADDYIAKPFHIREVQARVRNVLRRTIVVPPPAPGSSGEHNPARHRFVGWTAETDTFQLTNPEGEPCELTSTEFRLLVLFLEAPKRVLTRERIMDELNGSDWQPYDRTIDNQVARLRKKIEADPTNPVIIKTVRGIGYTFAADVTVG